jgi:hypothetical protein
MKTIVMAAVLGLAACGGTEQTAAPSRFAGTWNGQAEFNAAAPFAAPTTTATVTLTDMDAGTVRLAGFCPDGSGAIDLEFDADPAHAAVAHNVAVCPIAPVGACDKTQLIFSFVDAAVQPDGSLRGLASGWAVGCGASSTASLLLSAQKTAQ